MKKGAIINRDVVSLRAKHHIISYWTSQGGTGRTLCGLHVAVEFGQRVKWRRIIGGAWDVERDCATCLRVLVTRKVA